MLKQEVSNCIYVKGSEIRLGISPAENIEDPSEARAVMILIGVFKMLCSPDFQEAAIEAAKVKHKEH